MKRSNKQSPQATKLFDHIRELRTRFFVCLAVLIVSGFIVYFFYEPILTILRSPLNAPLYYSNPAGSFAFVMKICLMSAITITTPVMIYNLIMFIRPAFKETVPTARVYLTTIYSIIMATSGAIFAYFCIIPGTLKFFSGFQVNGLQALISADGYLNFVTNIIITFVIVFQIPLLIVFADRIKPIPPMKMLKMEKWVILGSLIIAAVVPFAFDLMTCLFIALPIVVLYNITYQSF
ncbi:MAG: twin-arginine translocase subunit TatC [Candidatus Saccharibacteria bacterium]